MKKLIPLLVLLWSFVADAAHVSFDLSDFMTGDIKRRRVSMTPQSTPRTNSTTIVTSDSIRFYTDSSGQFTVSNVVEGVYQVNVLGPETNTVFNISVPDTNIVVDASTLITTTNSVPAENVGYTQSQADTLFVQRLNGWSTNQILTNAFFKGSTNVFQHTNGAASGYVLKTDGTNAYWSAAGGGESTTGSNLSATNATTLPVFFQLNGTDLEFRTVSAGANMVITNQGTNLIFASTSAGGGGNLTTNANQFAGAPLSIKSGALLTNTVLRGASTTGSFTNQNNVYWEGNVFGGGAVLNEISFLRSVISYFGSFFVTNAIVSLSTTTDRVAVWENDGGGNTVLTNHPTVTPTELGYVDGATSSIQTQIDGNDTDIANLQAGTNANNSAITTLQNGGNLFSNTFTNHGTSNTNFIRSDRFSPMLWDFYDDFERPNTSDGDMGTSAPSGHEITLEGPSLGGANDEGRIEDGRAVIDLIPDPDDGDNPTFYYKVEMRKTPSAMGVQWIQQAGNGGVNLSGVTLAMAPQAHPGTYMVHASLNRDSCNVMISTNNVPNLFAIGNITFAALTNGQRGTFMLEYLGNDTLRISGNGTNLTVRHPQVDDCVGPYLYYQSGAATTNTATKMELEAVFAGASSSAVMPDFNSDQFDTYWNGPNGSPDRRWHGPNFSIADGALLTNISVQVGSDTISAAEIGYLDGVTSDIQTQIDNQALTDLSDIVGTFTSLADGNVLTYNSSASLWTNEPSVSGASELTGLNDVVGSFTSLADGNVLTYNSSAALWTNEPSVSGASELTGLNDVVGTFTSLADGNTLTYNSSASLWTNEPSLQPLIDDLEGATNGLNTRVDGHDTDIANLQGATNGITTRLDGHDTDIANLQGSTNGITTRLDGLDVDVSNLQGATNGLDSTVAGHTVDIGNLQGATNGLTSRLDGHDTDISNLQGSTNGLTTRVDNLDGATNGLTSRLDGHDTDIANLQAITNQNALLGTTNLATSYSIISNLVGGESLFYSLVEGSNITIDQTATSLVVNASGGATPGGSDREIQYNNSSSFDGASGVYIPVAETNLTVTGNFTNEFAYITELNVTGSGSEGMLILKDADASHQYAFKVPPTLATRFTNVYDFGASPSATEVLKVHSIANGVITWTNATDSTGGGGGGPGSLDFNVNQFNTNTVVDISDGAQLTNIVMNETMELGSIKLTNNTANSEFTIHGTTGNGENLTFDLDDAADVVRVKSDTGIDTLAFNAISLFQGATGADPVADDTDNLGFFAATTSSQFAGVISDETGTGRVVLGADADLTGDTDVTTLEVTNVIRFISDSYAKVGSGSTNIVVDANAHGYRWVDGSVNVNFSHIANQVNGEHPSLVYMLTNHTGTSGGVTFNAGTNNWIFAYAQATPTTITNGTALRVVIEPIGTTNALVGYEYYPVPTQ